MCCMPNNSLQEGVGFWDRKGLSGCRKYSRTLTRDRPKRARKRGSVKDAVSEPDMVSLV